MQVAIVEDVKFEDFKEELLFFLARRFSSIPLAEQIYKEMKLRIEESDILALIGNPKAYLSSYGLSLGVQLLREELVVNSVVNPSLKSASSWQRK